MRTAIKFILAYIGVSGLLALLWVVNTYPDLPTTPGQWAWLFVLALPLQLAGEFAGSLLWNNRLARRVGQGTAAQSFSWLRVVYALLVFLILVGLWFAIA